MTTLIFLATWFTVGILGLLIIGEVFPEQDNKRTRKRKVVKHV